MGTVMLLALLSLGTFNQAVVGCQREGQARGSCLQGPASFQPRKWGVLASTLPERSLFALLEQGEWKIATATAGLLARSSLPSALANSKIDIRMQSRSAVNFLAESLSNPGLRWQPQGGPLPGGLWGPEPISGGGPLLWRRVEANQEKAAEFWVIESRRNSPEHSPGPSAKTF